jgi:hypothetical protein
MLTTHLPAGEGRWQLTAGPVEPMPAEITRSIARADGVTIDYDAPASATKYRIEESIDTGRTWKSVQETSGTEYTLTGIAAPAKVHLRIVALDGAVESRPGHDFPAYVTAKPVDPPAGLRLALGQDDVKAGWGKILGEKEYVLYRRARGETAWNQVYRGPSHAFEDRAPGVIPAYSYPGLEADAGRQPAPAPKVYEYCVTAVDGIGEGARSGIASTDPANWRNWLPSVPMTYTRRSAYWLPPYVNPDQVPPAFYPQSESSSVALWHGRQGGNIAVSQRVPVAAGTGWIEEMPWGIVPVWAKETSKALINPRSESVREKQSFKSARPTGGA